MNLYYCKWFSNVEWGWMEATVMAPSEGDAANFVRERDYVDVLPYHGTRAPKDSLFVEFLSELKTTDWVVKPRAISN